MNPDEQPRDDVPDLLALGAAGALTDDQYRSLDELLAADPELAREYAELQESAAVLAEATSEDPPAHLRASVLQAIGDVEQPPAASRPRRSGNVVPIHHRRWMIPASVAAAVLMLVVGGLVVRNDADAPGDRMADVLDADDGVTVELAGALAGLRLVTSNDADAAVLMGSGLRPPDPGMVFQLWAVHDDDMAAMGTFTPAASGAVAMVIERAGGDAEWAVTVEPEGGSDQPTSDPVAVSPGLAQPAH